ncbi:hemoglobin [Paracoccus alcaliphilus]|uniref:Hemoglobin n=1 Tax=Paracoccus alcaliphilus TaxID=34002 RepID=A0A1H8FLD0_9RHOB|nr:group III truncated hemoglobin [Paracoccus alcaliphilus]WCR19366.1 group III truncated hemoglobin [Paracoccus alcaliphilus]SEN32492.1 hemoglobin [Paracoccus alcaliphilus]
MIPPRFLISEDDIDRVVRIFYAAIRRHEVLGPVFAGHVTDWPAHEAKIAGFWRRAILHQPGYDGNPMQVHLAAGDVRSQHFPIWLALFDETLRRTVTPEAAVAWSALAHRIGRGLRMGVEDISERNRQPGPPILR